MIPTNNQIDFIGKEVFREWHNSKIRKLVQENIGKIPIDCDTDAAIQIAGFIHIQGVADPQNFRRTGVMLRTEGA